MTVSSELNRKTYTGDDVTTSFATSPVVFFDTADLTVYVVVTATGAETLLTENTHYTVSGGAGSTGTVDLSGGSSPHGALATGTTLVIVRDVAITQEVDFVNNDGSDAEVAEDALDKITMILQQLNAQIERSFTLPESDVSGASTELPTPTASRLIGWNAAGDALQNYSAEALDLALTTAFTLTLLDDEDADAFFQTLVDGATAITTPASGDIVLLSDISETPDDGRKITLANLLKVINDLTAETAPATGDKLALYDADGAATDAITLENLFKIINSFTAMTDMDAGSDKVAVYDASGSAVASIPASAFLRKNMLINGAFDVVQRGTSFTSATTPANSDDTYLFDCWTLLSDGNDIVDVTQNTATVPTGSLNSLALDVETANKKFGVIQFIEQKNCHRAIGGTVTLSFKARKGGSNATVGTMRAAVIAWNGTADSVTSDIISAWEASGTNPTLVANWTYENTPADLTLTTSFQKFTISGISLDTASAKNIAVFLYYNNADGTVGDFMYITDVQLEPGSVATDFEYRTSQDELLLAKRYYWRIAPGSTGSYGVIGQNITTTDTRIAMLWPVEMRTPPTIGSGGSINVTLANGTSQAVTGLSGSSLNKYAGELSITVAANLVAGNATRLFDTGGASYIEGSAEL